MIAPYNKTNVIPVCAVTEIAIVCYKEHPSAFDETHDFWELLYADRGRAELYLEEELFAAEEGDVLFYAPGTRHRSNGNWGNTCAGFVSFACDAPFLAQLQNRCIHLDADGKRLLRELFSEGAQYMETLPHGSPVMGQRLKQNASQYELQIVKNQVELLLLHLFRALRDNRLLTVAGAANAENFNAALGDRVRDFAAAHLQAPASAEDAARALGISVSKLKTVCRRVFGCGYGTYCTTLRMDEAKRLILETPMNFTEIASYLGFSSIHYFSKAFKKAVGMTPSRYSKSVIG